MNLHASTIYGLVDPRTGDLRYIGKTFHEPEKRLRQHLGEAQRMKYRSARLCWLRALAEEGLRPEMIPLEQGHATIEEQNEAEIFFIAYFKSIGARLLNATPGGDGQSKGYKPAPETLAKMSASMKGKNRIPKTPEQRERIRQQRLGARASEESKRKVSETLKALGHRPNREAVEKSARGKQVAVRNITTGQVFESVKRAAEDCGTSRSSLEKHLSGLRSSCSGMRFEYVPREVPFGT